MLKYIILGVLLVAVVVQLEAVSDFLAPAYRIKLASSLQSPSRQHWFGTDHLGRDLFLRTVVGTVHTVLIATVVRLLAVVWGASWGLLAAFWGGTVDNIMMRLVDVIQSFPDLLLAIGLSVAVGRSSIATVILVLVFVSWPGTARIIRSRALQVRRRAYVESAFAVGGTPLHILRCHLAPGCQSQIRTAFFIGFGATMMAEASLSFLGLGPQSTVTLGTLIQLGFPYLLSVPRLCLFPAAVLSILVIAALDKA